MVKTGQDRKASSLNGLTEDEKERALYANEVYSKACEDSGIHVSSWRSFKAWQEYVNGKITDDELSEKAKSEIEEFSKSFGKYVVIQKEDPRQVEEEAEMRKRARRASQIYREVCGSAGMTLCFFNDFLSWSDFVEGRIDESEFFERVRAEVMEMAGKHT